MTTTLNGEVQRRGGNFKYNNLHDNKDEQYRQARPGRLLGTLPSNQDMSIKLMVSLTLLREDREEEEVKRTLTIPKPIRGSPFWYGYSGIPVSVWGSPNRFGDSFDAHPHSGSGIPVLVWGFEDPRFGLGIPESVLGFI